MIIAASVSVPQATQRMPPQPVVGIDHELRAGAGELADPASVRALASKLGCPMAATGEAVLSVSRAMSSAWTPIRRPALTDLTLMVRCSLDG